VAVSERYGLKRIRVGRRVTPNLVTEAGLTAIELQLQRELEIIAIS
jgi:hypothetical protein